MNTPNTNKNIALYNNQTLDSFSDTIISFEYSRYNPITTPTGGIAVIFFDSIIDMPRGGGPGNCLGYLPSPIITDRCMLGGYKGLAGAILGIGFDSSGQFALEQNGVTGITLSAFKAIPTIAVRGSIVDNYKLLYNLSDDKTIDSIPGLENFSIDKQIPNDSEQNYRAVRIIVAKQFSEITVQLKENIKQPDFVTVFKLTLPDIKRTAFKVGLTHTTDDPDTKFLIKNFNIAGFPGTVEYTDLITGCQQHIRIDGTPAESNMAMGREFISVPVNKKLVTYTTDLNRYNLENILYTGAGVKILGQDENTIVGKINNTANVVVYEFLGQKLARANVIETPDGSEASAADVDGDTMVICTKENEFLGTPGSLYIFKYITESTDPTLIGTWVLFQTILSTSVLSGAGMGTSAQLYDRNLLIGNSNEWIHAFQKTPSNNWELNQTIYSPASGASRFGSSMSLYERDLVVGAPYANRQTYNTLGQGEVFHFYLSPTSNNWNYIMALGDFYAINTVAGNFGSDVKLYKNICVVGSPGEAYLETGQPYESPNVGRAYVFNKTTNGLFTQGTVLTPLSTFREKYSFFGSSVNVYENFVSVVSPFTPKKGFGYLSIYDTRCLFTTPPTHQSVPDCSIGLIDRGGYVIDLINNTYMQNLSCLLNP